MRLAAKNLTTGDVTHIDLEIDRPVRGGRSGHGADIDLGSHASISRSALALCRREGERLAVHGLQSVGAVEVLASADRPLAVLRRAETHVFAPIVGSLIRIVAGANLAEVRIIHVDNVVGESVQIDAAAATVSPWSQQMLWYPEPQQEWMIVAVLTVLAHEQPAPFRGLRRYAGIWFGMDVSAGRLTGRLDKAIDHLGLTARGDKIPLIARRVIDSGLVGETELNQVRAELARREERFAQFNQD